MIPEPRCSKRKCKHFTGVVQSDGTEATELPACKAFPNGIPFEISYGDNPHTTPYPGDNGIQYEVEDV